MNFPFLQNGNPSTAPAHSAEVDAGTNEDERARLFRLKLTCERLKFKESARTFYAGMKYTPRTFRHFNKKVALIWWSPSRQLAKVKVFKSNLGGLPNLVAANTENKTRRESLAIKLKTKYFSLGPAGEDKD